MKIQYVAFACLLAGTFGSMSGAPKSAPKSEKDNINESIKKYESDLKKDFNKMPIELQMFYFRQLPILYEKLNGKKPTPAEDLFYTIEHFEFYKNNSQLMQVQMPTDAKAAVEKELAQMKVKLEDLLRKQNIKMDDFKKQLNEKVSKFFNNYPSSDMAAQAKQLLQKFIK